MKTKKLLSMLLSLTLALSLCTPLAQVSLAADTDCYVNTKAGKMPAIAPTIDGMVNATEWGDPVIVTSPNHVDTNWTNGYLYDDNKAANADQRAKVWLTNDEEYIYIAGTLDKEEAPGQWTDTYNTNSPMMKVMIGAQGTTALKEFSNGAEQRIVVMMKFDATGAMSLFAKERAETSRLNIESKLTANYRYDAEGKIYHYELKIPYTATNIDLTNSNNIAMAVMFGGSTPAGGKNNQYYIGGYTSNFGLKSDAASAANNSKMYDVTYNEVSYNFALKMALNTDFGCYIQSQAGAMPAIAPTIDGMVNATEWGDPVIVTSPNHVDTNWTNGYLYDDNKAANADQRAKVWLTNDEEYIYIAGTLDKEEAPGQWTDTYNTNSPMMKVMIGAQGTTALKEFSNGAEQRIVVMMKFDATGAMSLFAKERAETSRLNIESKLTANYRYDAEGKIYHYELKIPYTATNIDLTNSSNIAMAVMFGGSTPAGGKNNQYYIGGYTSNFGLKSDAASAANNSKMYDVTYNEVSYNFALKMALNPLSLQGLLNKAQAGDTVTLTKDYTVESLLVPSGVTLDLNGHALTATEGLIALDATVVDGDGKSGTGLIQAEFIQVNQNNSQLPLYDTEAGGYRLYTYKFMGKIRTENVPANAWKYAVRLELPTAKAYALLAEEANQKMVGLDLQLLNADGTAHSEIIPCRFSAETMQKYADLSQDLDVKKALALKVFGKDKVEENGLTLVAAARLVTRTGVDLTPNFE